MASRGSISANANLNYNPQLYLEWNDIYYQILDQYQSGGVHGVKVAAKNIEDHIVSGRADLSKSVISSTVSAYKACEHTFRNYSRTVLQVSSRKWDIPGPRLLVAGTYNRNIGWAHFDPQTNSSVNRDKDSRHFLAVYVQEECSNKYFILSLQVRDTHPFLMEYCYGNDSSMYRSVSHTGNLQMRHIAK